jgi:hypothetical protein
MTDNAEGIQRPREVMIGVAVLALIYVYGLYGAIENGLLSANPSRQAFWKEYLSLVITPILILGIWFGMGSARMVSAILFLGGLVAIPVFINAGGVYVPSAAGILWFVAHAAGLVLLFLPASNAWFRGRKQQLKRHSFYPFGLAIGIVFGIPLVLVLLMNQPGMMMGGVGTALFLAIMYLFYVPAIIFGRPHFMFGIGAGPADNTGVVLMIAFYAFIAAVLWAGLWLMRKEAKSRWTGGIIATVVLGLLAVMIVPLVRDRSSMSAALRAKVAAEQAKLDVVLADYPELEGPFAIHDEGGRFGIKSSGRWKVAKGRLEIVADSTEIWNRFPRCTDCAGLKSWQFELRSARNSRGAGLAGERSGFSPMTDIAGSGPNGKIAVSGHRMAVSLTQNDTVSVFLGDRREDGNVLKYLPPGVLANYWIGIELEFTDEGTYPVSATNPFMFADVLAAKGLAHVRCAAPRNIADAVERACHDALAQMLQDPLRRADIDKGDENLRTISKDTSPLQAAVGRKDTRSVDLLLENGANPDQIGYTGYTLLMSAVEIDADDIVASLARHKAKVDEKYTKFPGQNAGKTALILAANRGRTEAIKALLAAGADKSIKDGSGHTALEHAEYFRHPEAAALLK